MRQIILVLALIAGFPRLGVADDLEGWCAQVKKASSVVICSDPELRQQAIERNRLFEIARNKLSPDDYEDLTEEQTDWIKSYTARCGVALDGPVIAQSVIECYRRESHARTAYLAQHLSAPDPTASTLPPCNSPAGLSTIRNGSGGCELGSPNPATTAEPRAAPALPTPPPSSAKLSDAALDEWMKCLAEAANTFADQPEPAQTVVQAALGSCGKLESDFMRASMDSGELTFAGFEKVKTDTLIPRVLARVMAVRAARAKQQRENPEAKPAIDYGRM